MIKPEIVVFAGPNGSGKSTITELLKPPYDYINADEIKKHLKCSDIEAAKIAESQREALLSQKKNFSFETVLSTDRNLNLLKKAKYAGYFIKCFYVLTADPIVNVARVKLRALTGGHDVPEDKIISRYDKALALIPELISVCDICNIYDNTGSQPYRIFKKRKDICFYDDSNDFWLLANIKALTKIYDAEKRDLN
ncbi:MAG: hypothetical protein IJ299_05070 [Oscillospiraceae bacterium]|nr:hypothetical protein [Oscillospiraceae bacterium]